MLHHKSQRVFITITEPQGICYVSMIYTERYNRIRNFRLNIEKLSTEPKSFEKKTKVTNIRLNHTYQ